ncbi:hypothetical protein JR065_01250 [Xanthomonas sp. AmX2]|uniref:hypothetical protein n=1 Tax=Xanthomonas sp. TaxID=29446 RepID=UPI00197D8CC7|nr:hypothetical protein [Xanthomonas sp.]MBN6148953.1 hypothetical protein [Xanthomonas sp.]
MPRTPDPSAAPLPHPLRLLRWVLDDDLDAAIDAGLMDYRPAAGDDALDPLHPQLSAQLLAAQRRLREAWDARERYRARSARLARRGAEREARRAPPPATPSAAAALPPAAAAILARAKARAAERGTR